MTDIKPINITRLDLNLLKTFDAIMRTRCVTKAAGELSRGQPATSQALGRLRAMFGDELFVRTAGGMVPTSRALAISAPIARALTEIASTLDDTQCFNASQVTHNFRIGMSDYLETTLLPELLKDVMQTAPNVTFTVVQIELDGYMSMFDEGQIDLAIGYLRQSASWHERKQLLRTGRRCVYSRKLVSDASPIELQDYVAHRHVVRSLAGNTTSFIDDTLEQLGLNRDVVLSTPSYSALPIILQSVPLIATLPQNLVEFCCSFDDLIASDLPFEAPRFDISMLWHSRHNNHPPLTWLREKIHTIFPDANRSHQE